MATFKHSHWLPDELLISMVRHAESGDREAMRILLMAEQVRETRRIGEALDRLGLYQYDNPERVMGVGEKIAIVLEEIKEVLASAANN